MRVLVIVALVLACLMVAGAVLYLGLALHTVHEAATPLGGSQPTVVPLTPFPTRP